MKRTVMVLVDFKRAFDTVWKVGLLHKLLALEIPSCYIKWIKQFLSDRQGRVSYGVAKSGYKKFHEGLPQGSVLSPTLFLCFINDITDKLPPNCEVSLFADDLALWTQSSDIDEAESSMQKALDVLENWSKKWKLEINVEKTEVTYFSNDNQEAKHQPYLELFGEVLNYNPYPRFLGVTFDRQLTFNGHIDILVKKVKTRLKIMQTLKGKTWGQNRSDLRIVYLTYIRSCIDYCCAAWAPSTSKTSLDKLETVQNSAARIITQCTKTTQTDALLTEANLLPLKDRMKELGAIAFEKSLRLPPENPRRKVAEMEGPPKRLKRGNWRDSSTKTITEAKLDNLPRQELQQPLIQHNLTTTTFGEELNQKIKHSDDNEAKRKAAKEHWSHYHNQQ